MTLTLTLNKIGASPGTQVAFVKPGVKYSKALKQLSTMDVVIRDDSVTNIPQWTPIELAQDGTVLFKGFVKDVTNQFQGAGMTVFRKCQCIGTRWLLAKRRGSVSLQNATPYQIAQAILANVPGVGLSLNVNDVPIMGNYPDVNAYPGDVPTWPLGNWINDFTHAGDYVDLQMDDLVDRIMAYWYIDNSLAVKVKMPGDEAAPWVLTESDIERGSEVNISNQDYCNTIQLTANSTTVTRSDSFKGDGAKKTFQLVYPCSKVPTLYVNGVAVNASLVGIQNVDSGKYWWWSGGSDKITMDDSQTPLSSSDTLRVDYQGTITAVVQRSDPVEIARLALLDGSDGIVERQFQATGLSLDAVNDLASSELATYSVTSQTYLDFSTRRSGLDRGQYLQVQLPSMGLPSNYLLIESVSATLQDDESWAYDVLATSGILWGDWTRTFANQDASGRGASII